MRTFFVCVLPHLLQNGPKRFTKRHQENLTLFFQSAVHNASNQPRLAVFTQFSRRDSPILLANPIPNPSPVTLARYYAEIQANLAG